ncbi:MAG: hypothetical protein LBU83_11165 [Bacteroidales bacterium]|nr:hypothetical protein [Bacteroidales bacterium]
MLQIDLNIVAGYSPYEHTTSVKITETATGAFLEYSFRQYRPVANKCDWAIELDENEWHDFIISLYQSGIRGWGHNGYSASPRILGRHYDIKITTNDESTLTFSPADIQHPLDLRRFDTEISQFIRKIMFKRMMLHSAEYAKKFGMPIPSHFQRSMCEITLYGGNNRDVIRAFLTNSIDSVYTFFSMGGRMRWETHLPISDWMDIVYVFNSLDGCLREWNRSSRDRNNPICLPTWDALNETMAGIKAKIKKDNGIDVFEMILEENYKKRFGVEISDFERSLIIVNFRIRVKENIRFIEVKRHTNGALMTNERNCTPCLFNNDRNRCRERCQNLVAELDIGEWLDFVHALHKIRINQWSGFESRSKPEKATVLFLDSFFHEMVFSGCDSQESERTTRNIIEEWSIELNFFDNQPLRYSSDNTYPSNWSDLSKLMSDLEMKILNRESN